jgi:hypothetical protein
MWVWMSMLYQNEDVSCECFMASKMMRMRMRMWIM